MSSCSCKKLFCCYIRYITKTKKLFCCYIRYITETKTSPWIHAFVFVVDVCWKSLFIRNSRPESSCVWGMFDAEGIPGCPGLVNIYL